jgi:hypothetical protein
LTLEQHQNGEEAFSAGGGILTNSFPHWTHRALIPTISQAWSSATIPRLHFGHLQPSSVEAKSYSGPTYAQIM